VPDVLRAAVTSGRRAARPRGALVLAAVACGAPSLDGRSAESQLLARLQAANGPAIAAVDCPDEVEVRARTSFACTATEPDGATWTIEVTQLDDEGTLDYRIAGSGSP
jgi:hypothetical protein